MTPNTHSQGYVLYFQHGSPPLSGAIAIERQEEKFPQRGVFHRGWKGDQLPEQRNVVCCRSRRRGRGPCRCCRRRGKPAEQPVPCPDPLRSGLHRQALPAHRQRPRMRDLSSAPTGPATLSLLCPLGLAKLSPRLGRPGPAGARAVPGHPHSHCPPGLGAPDAAGQLSRPGAP